MKQERSKIGQAKMVFERGRMWLGIAQFGMIGFLFVGGQDYLSPSMMVILILIGLSIMTAIDVKVILPREYAEAWRYNPEFMELKADVKFIKEAVKNEKHD